MAQRPDPKHIEPGARLADLSAQQLNDVIDVCRSVLDARGDGPGLTVSNDGGVLQISLAGRREGFWAEITGEGTTTTAPNKYGYYSWREVVMRPDGTFATPPDCLPRVGLLSGTRPDPARDLFFKSAVPVGLPVFMMPMPTSVGGETSNWIFMTPDLVQVVRFGAGARSPWGDYDGYVQRFNGTDFSDAENVWLKTP